MLDPNYYFWGPLLLKQTVSDDIIKEFIEEGDRLTIENDDWSHELAGEIREEKKYSDEFSMRMGNKLAPYFDIYFNVLKNQWKPHINNLDFYYCVTNMWINYQRKNEFNPIHAHNGDLSFVLYVDIPEEIKLQKHPTNRNMRPGAISFMWGSNKSTLETDEYINAIEGIDRVTHHPVTGELFIFPATLQHMVAPFYADVVRKSVSGNLIIHRNYNG